MQRLIQGYRRFHSHVFPQRRRRYEKLSQGQSPKFLFITCADSRVDPLEFTSTNAGDMFLERSVGNLIPLPGSGEHEGAAAIEYAVVALGVEDIIICGHSQCGAMKALLDPESTRNMPTVAAWLRSAAATREAVEAKHGHLEGEELLSATIRENVLVQLDHLRRQPSVADRLAEGKVRVHGWVFELENGRVVAHDPRVDRFVPLPLAYGDAPPVV